MSTNRIVGADSYSAVSAALIGTATSCLGQAPAFWGRYFTSTTTSSGAEYEPQKESAVFASHGLRVLPIARQTNNVGGGQSVNGEAPTPEQKKSLGFSDGQKNATDLVQRFGLSVLEKMSAGVRIFLDVEGSGASHLDVNYYLGWTEGLASVATGAKILPCVYGIPLDSATWGALAAAVRDGAPCGGLWLSHPFTEGAAKEAVAWNPTMVKTPTGIALPPTLLWQYCFGQQLDRNLVNPDVDADELLATFVLPSATS